MNPDPSAAEMTAYRGRLAPTPSGHLHLGHARTFGIAHQRARAAAGTLIYRTEDLDPLRCSAELALAAMNDLRWWGLDWDEGPDCGGGCGPYVQSERRAWHLEVLDRLIAAGKVYPSPHSRKDIAAAQPANSPVDGEQLFPPALRSSPAPQHADAVAHGEPWRFKVPDGRIIRFVDGHAGICEFRAGLDFGDFLVWRREDVPAYELAVVADDHAMRITEVVRGADLLVSTARQILLYEALGWQSPAWFHVPLVVDPATGERMAKTRKSMSLAELRDIGLPPGMPAEFYFSRLA